DIDWVFQRNVQFMEDYFRGDRQVPARVRAVITAHVNAAPGLSLDQLLCSTAHTASADDVFSLIAGGGLYVDFRRAPFTEPLKVAVFVDQRAPAPVVCESGIGIVATNTAIQTRLARASEDDLRIANMRLRYVSASLRGEVVQNSETPAGRTMRRWIAAYRKAESATGSGYIGL